MTSARDFFRFFLDRPRGMTTPHYQLLKSIEPATTGPRFTGPILLLIDELNLSAAEYVAATLVDNGRAVAFGARTSGAGGDQRWISPEAPCPQGRYSECAPPEVSSVMRELGITGLAFTTTIGVRVRADGTIGEPIENRGVNPKVEYRISLADLHQGFAPMRARIVEQLQEM